MLKKPDDVYKISNIILKVLHHKEEEASLLLHEINLDKLHGYTQRDVISVIPINNSS